MMYNLSSCTPPFKAFMEKHYEVILETNYRGHDINICLDMELYIVLIQIEAILNSSKSLIIRL